MKICFDWKFKYFDEQLEWHVIYIIFVITSAVAISAKSVQYDCFIYVKYIYIYVQFLPVFEIFMAGPNNSMKLWSKSTFS